MTNKDLFVSRIFKHKYFRRQYLLDNKPKTTYSCVWKSIIGVLEIFKSGLSLSNGSEWRWKFTDSGSYSVKSGYELTRQWKIANQVTGGEVSDWADITKTWSKFWKIHIPDRVKLVTWNIFHDSLPLFTNLIKKGCLMNTMCVFCSSKQENANHLFSDCWWESAFGDH